MGGGGGGDTLWFLCVLMTGDSLLMNTATIRFFTLPLQIFLDRKSLAHFVIFVIRLTVTVEFS